MLTKQHHQLVAQFIEFKERTDVKYKKADAALAQMTYLETALAEKGPVMEAEHAIDERTALTLYDSLVPKIKENRRFSFKKSDQFSIADFRA